MIILMLGAHDRLKEASFEISELLLIYLREYYLLWIFPEEINNSYIYEPEISVFISNDMLYAISISSKD